MDYRLAKSIPRVMRQGTSYPTGRLTGACEKLGRLLKEGKTRGGGRGRSRMLEGVGK